MQSQLENDFMKSLQAEVTDDYEAEAIRPLSWYPGNVAWHLNFSRMQLRKNQALERFHEFLKQENEIGNITRQEAVSMVPPLFLDVLPDHHILDMCAAPGSRTFRLLEIIHQSIGPEVGDQLSFLMSPMSYLNWCADPVLIHGRRSVILPSMFPSGQSCKEHHMLCNDLQEDVKLVGNDLGQETVGIVVVEEDQTSIEHENTSDDFNSNNMPVDTLKAAATANEVSGKSVPPEELDKNSIAMEVSGFPLHYCMRIVPHGQNSGAFFIAVLQKLATLPVVPENHASEPSKFRQVSENTSENPEDENEAEKRISGQVSIQVEENTNTNVLEWAGCKIHPILEWVGCKIHPILE